MESFILRVSYYLTEERARKKIREEYHSRVTPAYKKLHYFESENKVHDFISRFEVCGEASRWYICTVFYDKKESMFCLLAYSRLQVSDPLVYKSVLKNGDELAYFSDYGILYPKQFESIIEGV